MAFWDLSPLFQKLAVAKDGAGASYWTQLDRVVIGARDEKRGFSRIQEPLLHPRTFLEFGLMATESSELLTRFFQDKRRIQKL